MIRVVGLGSFNSRRIVLSSSESVSYIIVDVFVWKVVVVTREVGLESPARFAKRVGIGFQAQPLKGMTKKTSLFFCLRSDKMVIVLRTMVEGTMSYVDIDCFLSPKNNVNAQTPRTSTSGVNE